MFVLKCKECKKESKFANIESVKTVEKVFLRATVAVLRCLPPLRDKEPTG